MEILLVGSGNMASEYMKVLTHLNLSPVIVGRKETNLNKLKAIYTGYSYFGGGLSNYLQTEQQIPETAIVAVNIDQLQHCTLQLIKAGVKKILIEKPAALELNELNELKDAGLLYNAKLNVAYNRRFYHSIDTLKNLLQHEGGIKSLHFEFTEWLHTIDTNFFSENELCKWILSNSSHVIDTVFHLIGQPAVIHAHITQDKGIDWHPSGTIFTGSGYTVNNIPFTYHSNWESAGRWAIEISTAQNRYYLKPMEKLQVQAKGSVQINDIALLNNNDLDFKPGLLKMIQAFLNPQQQENILCTIEQHIKNTEFFNVIAGYKTKKEPNAVLQ